MRVLPEYINSASCYVPKDAWLQWKNITRKPPSWHITVCSWRKGWFKRNALRLPWDKHKLQRMTGEIPWGNYGFYLGVTGIKAGIFIRYYNDNGSIKDVRRFNWKTRKIGY